MKYNAFYFDLDGTLYSNETGLMDMINERINEWILKTVPMDPEAVSAFRKDMFTRYGATLPGLAVEYGSDYYASMYYCHDLDVESVIHPNPELAEVLKGISGEKFIFTSSYRFYANRVLKALGILDCFDGVIDALDVYPKPKPAHSSFLRALEITARKTAEGCVFLDDQPRNIKAGHEVGFFSVQVGTQHEPAAEADAVASRIEDISQLFH